VDDAHAVGLAEGAGDLLGDVEDAGPGEGALGAEDLGEGTSLKEFESDIEGTVMGRAIVNDGNGIGVVQLSRHRGFSEEALAQGVVDAEAVGGV